MLLMDQITILVKIFVHRTRLSCATLVCCWCEYVFVIELLSRLSSLLIWNIHRMPFRSVKYGVRIPLLIIEGLSKSIQRFHTDYSDIS